MNVKDEKMRWKAILWDFDGTLADTGEDVWESLRYAAELCGGTLPEGFTKDSSNLGKSVKEIYGKLTPYPGEGQYARFEELVRIHYRRKNPYVHTCYYPGIEELIAVTGKQGVRHFIITMKPREALKNIFLKKGWKPFFEESVSPDSFEGTEKSKKEMIAYILEKYQMQEKDCVYVGDTWSDIRAARENRISCIAAAYGDGDEAMLRREQPDYLVWEPEGLMRIMEGHASAEGSGNSGAPEG